MKQSKLIIIAILVIGVCLVGWLVYHKHQTVVFNVQSVQSNSTNTPVQTIGVASSPLHNGLTYVEAVAKYPNRIQFTSCQAISAFLQMGCSL